MVKSKRWMRSGLNALLQSTLRKLTQFLEKCIDPSRRLRHSLKDHQLSTLGSKSQYMRRQIILMPQQRPIGIKILMLLCRKLPWDLQAESFLSWRRGSTVGQQFYQQRRGLRRRQLRLHSCSDETKS